MSAVQHTELSEGSGGKKAERHKARSEQTIESQRNFSKEPLVMTCLIPLVEYFFSLCVTCDSPDC